MSLRYNSLEGKDYGIMIGEMFSKLVCIKYLLSQTPGAGSTMTMLAATEIVVGDGIFL